LPEAARSFATAATKSRGNANALAGAGRVRASCRDVNRRSFLEFSGAAALSGPGLLAARAWRTPGLKADVLVAGGGVGGVAAALAACRSGRRVVMTEETLWLGGQLTSQAVPPDEHPWIEEAGCTRSYREFRERVRTLFRQRRLTAEAARNPQSNPGGGWVSRLCCEPRMALDAIGSMLAPHLASGRLTVLLGHRPVAVERRGDRLGEVLFEDVTDGVRRAVLAPFLLDATELGDLLPLGNVEHVTGAESRAETGEPSAPETADPLEQQGVTWCFAVEHHGGRNHVIGRPDDFPRWRDYVPAMTPPWTGRLFAWEHCDPVTLKARTLLFDPVGEGGFPNLWTYRRIRDASSYSDPGAFPSVCLVNWPQNDHWIAPLAGPGVTAARKAERMAEAKALSRSFLYWLQTEAPRPDGGTGWPGLRPVPDLLGTPDGFAMAPYIRESRRIRARFTVTERHVSTAARMEETRVSKADVRAAAFADSVGVGAYRIDLHPSTSGRNYVDLSSLPFQIPLGSLIPRRVENLLAAAKNAGVTHVTNGCYRLHPVEWNVGEAAGALAAFCLERRTIPAAVHASPALTGEFQKRLRDDGLELEWTVPVHPL